MQVNNSQPNFGSQKYSLGILPHPRAKKATRIASEVLDEAAKTHDIRTKVRVIDTAGTHDFTDVNNNVYITSVVSKANKTILEKILHFAHLMPRKKTKTEINLGYSDIEARPLAALIVNNVQSSIKKFNIATNKHKN